MVITNIIGKKLGFGNGIKILIYVFILSTEVLGEVYHFYVDVWWFDIVMHTYFAFIISYAGLYLIRYFNIKGSIYFVILFIFSLAMMTESVWEIFEFSMDRVIGTDMQKDTVIRNIGFGCSMSIVLFHGFIKNIPVELEEAATIDGCNMFQTFFLIVLPLLKGIMATVAVINVMWIWNDFLLPSLVINKNGMQTLPLRTYLFFGQFTKKWDLATAALVLCMIPIVIFYLSCQKHIVKGITAGVGK